MASLEQTRAVSIQLWFSWTFLGNQNNFIAQTPLQLDKKHLVESAREGKAKVTRWLSP